MWTVFWDLDKFVHIVLFQEIRMIRPKNSKISCNLLSASIFRVMTLSTNTTPCFIPFFTCLPLNSAILSPLQKKKGQRAVGYTQLKKKKFLISPSDTSTYKMQLDSCSAIPRIRSSWATPMSCWIKQRCCASFLSSGVANLVFCSPCF